MIDSRLQGRGVLVTGANNPMGIGAAVAVAFEFVRRHVARGGTWGRIANISTAGSDGFPSEVSYGAGKFALKSSTRAAAHELGQFGITVNVLAPVRCRPVGSRRHWKRRFVRRFPLGGSARRPMSPTSSCSLASEQARWATGQKVVVSGGHRM
jgi:3-oxoacyl-[acyl-carrier protein] reductase